MRVDPTALLTRLRIHFRRKGRALWASCPLAHGGPDKDASWSMRDDPGGDRHGGHYCFGCRNGGGPADLVSAVLGVELREALAWLRDGSALAPQLPERVVVAVRMVKGPFRLPGGVEQSPPFVGWPTPARDYLLGRGVTAEQAARWGLGFAVDGKLASRIVVPARDAAGRLASYVARAFAGKGQRYAEPTDEERPDRSVILGEHLWPARERRRVVLVGEGWFDAAAAERATGLPVGALRGSPSPADARWGPVVAKLATFPVVVHLVDPGSAGERLHADLRAALVRYSRVVSVRFAAGSDAASYARESASLQIDHLWADAELARAIEGQAGIALAGYSIAGSRDPAISAAP